jgi:hypothetical protein
VAFVRKKTGRADSDLCFKRIDTDTLAPACIDDPETNVIRPTWSPDGFSIVVISLVQDAAGALQSAELLQYNADRASAARPQRWQKQGVISTGLHPEGETDVAQYVAWSPSTDEPTLAVVANWARAGFLQVFLVPTPGNVVSDEATPLNVGACTLAWRPDAKALAVYQADDCASDRGDLVSVDPADPSHLRALRNVGVFNPAWAPIPPSE